MQKTTEKVRLSALTSAQTKITGVRPITKKTPKGIIWELRGEWKNYSGGAGMFCWG